jgi:Transposase
MVEGRGVQALGTFAEALRLHGGEPSQIEAIVMDMSASYMKVRVNTSLRLGSSLTNSTLWCRPAKLSKRCASNCSARELTSKWAMWIRLLHGVDFAQASG